MENMIREFRRRARYLVTPFLGSIALVYLGFYVVQGDRGLLAWIQRGQDVELAMLRLEKEAVYRDKLSNRVTLLRDTSLDLDLLEERARAVLNMAEPDEHIIMGNTD